MPQPPVKWLTGYRPHPPERPGQPPQREPETRLGHADPILRDLSRLVLARGLYDIGLNNFAHNPGYITDLKALAQSIADAHDPVYDAPYR